MSNSRKFGAFGAIVVIFIAFIVIYSKALNSTEKIVTITVTDKERITESDGEGNTISKYIVFAKGETFENTDDIFNSKYNSSDIQGALIRGKTYRVKVIGWRNSKFSSYRNIIEILDDVNVE